MANPVCDILLTEAPLRVTPEEPPTETGAVVDFWGVVRRTEGVDEISGIDYEAHRTMAEHQLRAVAEEASGRFKLLQVVIHHRVGFVAEGEPSLLVRVGSQHRAAAFRGSEWIVDELKKRATIWKHPAFQARKRPDSGLPRSEMDAAATPSRG